MLGLLGSLFKGGIGGIGKAVVSVKEAFSGNAEKQDERDYLRQVGALDQYGAEFNYRENRTWWDSFVDGLNRLIRPGLAVQAIAVLWLAYLDPVEFQVVMLALSTVPESLWFIIGTIVVFYFGGRMREKGLEIKHKSPEEVRKTIQSIKELRSLKESAQNEYTSESISKEDYEAEMADTSKPLSNAAIMEWNRQRKTK